MKKYNVLVNGTKYEVEIELSGGTAANSGLKAAPPPVRRAAPTAELGAGTQVLAPLPGSILSVKVKVGDTVQARQTLLVMEAMKMQNEIVAPASGTVTELAVKPGEAVNARQLLCVIG